MTPRRILLAGWLLFLLYCYPGFMLTEAADQLIDSRTGVFTDWHSPMMTEVWSIVGRFITGPAGLLFLQSLLLLYGSYRLMSRVMSDRAAAIAAGIVLVLPPLMATTAVICPEAQLVAFLVAAAAALSSERFWVRCAGLGLAVVGAAMRDGGALGAATLVIALFTWRMPQPGLRRIGISLAAAALVVVAAVGLDHALLDLATQRSQVALAMSDIVGTLQHADETDERVRPQLTGVPLRRDTELHGKDMFARITTQADRDALFDARRKIALGAPGAYLSHRSRVFLRLVGLGKQRTWQPIYTRHFQRDADYQATGQLARSSLVQLALIRIVSAPRHTFLFHPYFYLLLAFPLLVFAIAKRRRQAIVFLATGLAYMAAMFFLANRIEYRESHLLLVFTVLGAISLAASQARNKAIGDEAAGRRADDDEVQAGERRT